MRIRIGLENGIEGRSLAWALDFPGCFAYGDDGAGAIVAVPRALLRYEAWVNEHTTQPWFAIGDFDIRLVDTWQVYNINTAFEEAQEGIEINAWFRDDWQPLVQAEIDHGRQLLTWSRSDLTALLAALDEATLDAQHPGERWSIKGIVRHIANADWWYLSRLGLDAAPGITWPDDTPGRLQVSRARLLEVLPQLAEMKKVVGIDGEFWSPRKLLRRAIWHELDHIEHIGKLSGKFSAG